MSLRFDQPELLLLALAVPVLAVASWRMLAALDRFRRFVVVGLRAALLLCLTVVLAGPRTLREHDRLTIIGVLDVSGSVQRFAELPELEEVAAPSNIEYLRRWFREATQPRAADDRFGLVVFDGSAAVISVPVRGDYVDDNLDISIREGTNVAEAIRLALAMFPADAARRIVLVSDGNETAGDAVAAAREAAARFRADAAGDGRAAVPIDIVPITYKVGGDVQVARVESPPTAQPGQTVTVRVVIDATAPTAGRLDLRREGLPVDLNGDRPGTSRRVDVPAGRSVHLAQVVLGETPINRFEAFFEPLSPEDDALLDNNRSESFTATPSRGAVLILDGRPGAPDSPLAAALREAGIPVRVEPPHRLGEDLLSLQRDDLIIVDNVAAFELNARQQSMLARYVHDLGGGLIMVGGERGFGAGGWNGTPLEKVLPLELDPPREMRLASAALVLVLDKSGSMNHHVAGTRTTQQRIANEAAAMAIESLRRESLVGVVTFDFVAQEYVPLQRNDDAKAIADRVRGIPSDGGTNLEPALRMARRMLRPVESGRKLVVCLSDGRSHTTDLDDLVQAMAGEGIRLTTIAVGDDADHDTLRRLAGVGGGEFYPVRNPRTLPRVLVDSVQVINKPLIKEVPFAPVARPTGSTLAAGLDQAPQLDGLVITSARPEPTVSLELTDPDGVPLLAHWQVGLGRAAAFTSDADGTWSHRWIGWPGYASFWRQLARTIARPATSPDAELLARVRDGRLEVVLDAAAEDRGLLDYLTVDGTVYTPDGEAVPVRLRQTAPGRYETSLDVSAPGNYVVALSPRRGSRRLAPVIGGASLSTSAEFRRFESNERLMQRVREITGGDRLDVERSEGVALFDREDRRTSVAALPAWAPLLWLAAALLLVDVAGRRLAWDAALLRRQLRRAAARVTPAELRGREAAATLASLRQTSGARPRPKAPAPRTAARQEAAPPSQRPEPAAPEPSRVSAAIDALLGRRKDEPVPPDAEPDPDKPSEGATTTSSLLEAKRRARKNL